MKSLDKECQNRHDYNRDLEYDHFVKPLAGNRGFVVPTHKSTVATLVEFRQRRAWKAQDT